MFKKSFLSYARKKMQVDLYLYLNLFSRKYIFIDGFAAI